MAVKVTVSSAPKNRISINNQTRKTVRTASVVPDVSAINKLANLSDVNASDPDNNETLVYDAASGKYVIKTLPIVDGGIF